MDTVLGPVYDKKVSWPVAGTASGRQYQTLACKAGVICEAVANFRIADDPLGHLATRSFDDLAGAGVTLRRSAHLVCPASPSTNFVEEVHSQHHMIGR